MGLIMDAQALFFGGPPSQKRLFVDRPVAKYAGIQPNTKRLQISISWLGSEWSHEPLCGQENQPPVASLMHFWVKLLLAAPASFLSAACASHVAVAVAKAAAASFSHF